ncbi:hypothetical protein G4H71_00890 [Rhodococcus triatomae]|uniref:Cell division protein FtsL n=1 Tax=Rhodococcus triatomae TaxID=300028 RepID=A0A1G8D2K2_9NOCA|nr:hypothetical protein [Rhodococcus triatomae]QNG18526.1 hypothetical protein G4H72_07160 [Rhodococcus triatomae]QNG21805.1 hypothetical protein G4H71_00890 [Rhodococcus triatomae]SDH51912.1 hypothetical protein SAMN05444695_102180 [Rhodococcus triatomae]
MTVEVRSTVTRPTRERRSGAAARAYQKRSQRAASRAGAAVPEAAGGASVRRRAGSVAARIPFVATIIGLLSLGLAVTLLLTTRAAEDSYLLSSARAHNQSLTEQKSALERDVQTANSAPRLAEEAAALGLVPATDPARLVVHPDGTVEVVGTPKPADGTPVPPLDRRPAATDPTRPGAERQAPAAGPNSSTHEELQRVTPRPQDRAETPGRDDTERSAAGMSPVPAPAAQPPAAGEPATPRPGNVPPAEVSGEQLVPVTNETSPPAGQ